MAIASIVTITIDGKELKDFLSFRIEQSMRMPHSFQVVCRRDALEDRNGFLVDRSIDQIGAQISISIEGVGAKSSQFLFKGIITGLSATDNYGNSEITITGGSTDILMADRPRCRSFDNLTLKEIATNVVMPYPVDVVNQKFSPDNQEQFPYVVQYKESNLEFLKRLSTRHGEWFYNDGTGLILGPPAKEKVNLILGLDLSSFDISLKLDALNFKYFYYDYLKANKISSSSSQVDPSGSLNDTGKRMYGQSKKKYSDEAPMFYHHLNGQDSDRPGELNKVVEIEKKSRAAAMTQMQGMSTVFLKLGNVVVVKAKKTGDGVGDTDYGEYLVTSIVHTCDNLFNYQNRFTGIPSEAQIPPYADPEAKPWCEAQSAVVADRDDPEKVGRVKVRFYWQEDNQTTPWIRVAHPDAGKNKGVFSVPDLEDEVIVGFEGGDAEKPYVTGSFHNPHVHPSSGGQDLKDVKFMRSSKESTFVIDEREGKNRVAMWTGSKDLYIIELNSSEKILKIMTDEDLYLSGKNITLRAKESITIKADKDVKVTGNGVSVEGDTKIHGSNVSIKGDSQVKAEGATVSINGSGQTEIKGGTVMIN